MTCSKHWWWKLSFLSIATFQKARENLEVIIILRNSYFIKEITQLLLWVTTVKIFYSCYYRCNIITLYNLNWMISRLVRSYSGHIRARKKKSADESIQLVVYNNKALHAIWFYTWLVKEPKLGINYSVIDNCKMYICME